MWAVAWPPHTKPWKLWGQLSAPTLGAGRARRRHSVRAAGHSGNSCCPALGLAASLSPALYLTMKVEVREVLLNLPKGPEWF